MDFLEEQIDLLAFFGAVVQDKGQFGSPPQRQPVADFVTNKSRRRRQSIDKPLQASERLFLTNINHEIRIRKC